MSYKCSGIQVESEEPEFELSAEVNLSEILIKGKELNPRKIGLSSS